MNNIDTDSSDNETSIKENEVSKQESSSNELDEKVSDLSSLENTDKPRNKVLQKVSAVILVIALVLLVVIIEDEVSGKNRLKNIFLLLQKKIVTLIHRDEDAKKYHDYLYSLNVKNNENLDVYKNNKQDNEKEAINNETSVTRKPRQISENSEEFYRDIIDYDYMTEEQLIEAIDNDFQRDCSYYNQDSPVDSMVVKPFVTKIAIDKGYDNLMEKLCKTDCHPKNDLSKFNTLDTLPYATEQNSIKCLEVLLKNGADLKKEQENGKNLLHSAAQAGNILFAKKLLNNGIPINKETEDKKTPLYYAVKNNRHDMALFLVNCGAKRDKNLRNETKDYNMMKFLENGEPLWGNTEIQPEDIEWQEAYGYIKEGNLDELKKLVESGKDLSKMRIGGEPAPCIAATYHQYAILEYLIHQYDCKNLVDAKTGRNALHYAAKQADVKMVDLLLLNGFDANSKDLYDYTPLHHSVYNNSPDCLKFLLHHGADPDRLNLKKQSPLHLAIMSENIAATQLFLEEGANLNIQDFEGNTVLHYVAKYSSNKKVLDILYNYRNKFDLNIKNNENKTPRNINDIDPFDYYEKNRNMLKY